MEIRKLVSELKPTKCPHCGREIKFLLMTKIKVEIHVVDGSTSKKVFSTVERKYWCPECHQTIEVKPNNIRGVRKFFLGSIVMHTKCRRCGQPVPMEILKSGMCPRCRRELMNSEVIPVLEAWKTSKP